MQMASCLMCEAYKDSKGSLWLMQSKKKFNGIIKRLLGFVTKSQEAYEKCDFYHITA